MHPCFSVGFSACIIYGFIGSLLIVYLKPRTLTFNITYLTMESALMRPKINPFTVFILVIFTFVMGVLLWINDTWFIKEKAMSVVALPLIKTSLPMQSLTSEQIKQLAKILSARSINSHINPTLPQLAEQLKKSNNFLYYFGNRPDVTGRSMLVDSNEKLIFGFGGIGWHAASSSGKMVLLPRYRQESGVFKSWSKTTNGQDFYAILSDPVRNVSFIVRVNKQRGSCSPTEGETDETDLIVRDIQYRFDSYIFEDLGPISLWPDSDLAKIIQPGDLVVGYNLLYDVPQTHGTDLSVHQDSFGVTCASALIINRFGGKQQLAKELGREIPDAPSNFMYNKIYNFYHHKQP